PPRGGNLEGECPYGIVRQLFEPLLASANPDLHAKLFSGPAALVEPLLGASQPAASKEAPPAEDSFAILHGLDWLRGKGAFGQRARRARGTGRTPPPCGGGYTCREGSGESPCSSPPQPGRRRQRAAIPCSSHSSSPSRSLLRFAPNRLAVSRSPGWGG